MSKTWLTLLKTAPLSFCMMIHSISQKTNRQNAVDKSPVLPLCLIYDVRNGHCPWKTPKALKAVGAITVQPILMKRGVNDERAKKGWAAVNYTCHTLFRCCQFTRNKTPFVMIFFCLCLSNENLKHAHVASIQILTKNELNPLIEPFIRTYCLH